MSAVLPKSLNNFYSKLQNQGASINVRSCGEPWIAFSSLHSPLDLRRHLFCNHPFPLTAAHHPSQAALLLMNFLSCSLKHVNTQSHSNWILNLSKFLSLSLFLSAPAIRTFFCLQPWNFKPFFIVHRFRNVSNICVEKTGAVSKAKPCKSCWTSRARFYEGAILDLSYSTDNSQSDWPVQKGLREGKKELSFYRFTHNMLQNHNMVQMITSSGNVRNQTM